MLTYETTGRGFRRITMQVHGGVPPGEASIPIAMLVQESSAIRVDEVDGGKMPSPGSSCLWIGDKHHLDRYEVAELAGALSHWLQHGQLPNQPR